MIQQNLKYSKRFLRKQSALAATPTPCRACILDVHTTINFPQASWSFIMSRAQSVSKLGQEFYGNMALDTSWPIGQRAAQLSLDSKERGRRGEGERRSRNWLLFWEYLHSALARRHAVDVSCGLCQAINSRKKINYQSTRLRRLRDYLTWRAKRLPAKKLSVGALIACPLRVEERRNGTARDGPFA